MVTPASLNGAYWALAVPAASVDATKSPAITVLMNASLMWSSPLSAERFAFWHMCGGLSVPTVRLQAVPRRPRSRTAALRSLPADWRGRRSSGHGTGALESAPVTHGDTRCRYLITASRTKNAGRHGEAEGPGGLEVHDELELGRLQHGQV